MRKYLAVIFLIITAIRAFPQLSFSENSILFGDIRDNAPRKSSLTVFNESSNLLSVRINPFCSCIHTDKIQIKLSAGEKSIITFTLDPTDESGDITKRIVFEITEKNKENGSVLSKSKSILFAYASIISQSAASEDNNFDFTYDDSKPDILFFYSKGCGSCSKIIQFLKQKYEKTYNIKLFDIILEKNNLEYLEELLAERGTFADLYPVLVYKNSVLQGDDEIYGKTDYIINTDSAYLSKTGNKNKNQILTFFASIFTGLTDGINPCAFTTLIFLISALAYVGKNRKEVLITGLTFSFTVFICYFLIGLGVFQALRLLSSFRFISCLIIWLFVLFVIILTVLSFIDVIRIRQGKTSKIILQLPKKAKQIIHSFIRTKIRSALLIGSSILLGFLVTIFELGCTGQMYIPYLSYLLSTTKSAIYIIYLLIYNIGFIIPLLLVFILTYTGLTNDRLSEFFKRNLLIIKIIIFLVFLILLILLIVTNLQCFVFINA